MAQSGRKGMADAQKTELWHRWRKGELIHEISRATGERRTAIYTVLYRHGGLTPPDLEHKPVITSVFSKWNGPVCAFTI